MISRKKNNVRNKLQMLQKKMELFRVMSRIYILRDIEVLQGFLMRYAYDLHETSQMKTRKIISNCGYWFRKL